jgi:hypothetical protein
MSLQTSSSTAAPSADRTHHSGHRRARRIAATVKRALQMIIHVLESEFEV